MKLVKPDFYDAFHCIADRCSDTCCVGWEIDVDDFSQECYRHVGGKLGKKLQENIVDGHFQLLPGDRCPFLNSKNFNIQKCNKIIVLSFLSHLYT